LAIPPQHILFYLKNQIRSRKNFGQKAYERERMRIVQKNIKKGEKRPEEKQESLGISLK